MAEIHPNDIELATFADVGNVERLRTSAKTVVEAINENLRLCVKCCVSNI